MKATRSFFRTAPSFLLLGLAAAVTAAVPSLAGADEAEATGSVTVTSSSLSAGGRYADTDGDRTFIRPYDPMDSGAVFDFELLNVKPGGRSFDLQGSFRDDQDWSAGAEYTHGADFSIGVGAQQFFHALPHREYAPDFETPVPGFGPVHVVGSDADPADREYHSEFSEITGSFRLRAPAYPAHVRGDARLYRKEGPNQLRYFFRSCSTSTCHTNSRTREIDQETQEYNIGFDAHVGHFDVVYNRNFLNFDDKADDPVDFFGPFFLGRPRPGMYPHHTNPETKSYYDEIKVNTNLTNRAVLALHYIGGQSENTDSDITEDSRRFVASASYTASARHFVSARYVYNDLETKDLPEELADLRETIGDAVEPGTTENTGEVTYRYTLRPGSTVHAHLRHTDLSRSAADESGLPESSTLTSADVDARFRLSPGLQLEGEVAREWADDPAYATDFTARWKFGAGAVWTPEETFSLLARYSGFFGENDDDAALQRAYYRAPAPLTELKRETDGHSALAVATWTPAEALTLVLSYTYSRNDISQDQVIGSALYPDLSVRAENVPFESMYQIAHLEGTWNATGQLTLRLGGLVLAGEESWEPESPADPALTEGLSDIARRDFVKYMVDAEAELALSDTLSVTLGGFYADYDDRTDDGGDGSGAGLLAACTKKW